ncbi:hypothetical protein [Aureimonas glaciei]|uniref:Uncharacterized protein n=1 Tax=Aureimonas glaciei TaxID=1776957 RepID=A0A917DIV1_9HYPH|nr:hypothetical protein [Aureimonas glaciei]GGD41320.1 hypothetical protein GCM10011335_50070 [Aureimonas glaciei]
MPADDKPRRLDEIIDAVEDEEALVKNRIERAGFWVWGRVLALARLLRGAPKARRHRPF